MAWMLPDSTELPIDFQNKFVPTLVQNLKEDQKVLKRAVLAGDCSSGTLQIPEATPCRSLRAWPSAGARDEALFKSQELQHSPESDCHILTAKIHWGHKRRKKGISGLWESLVLFPAVCGHQEIASGVLRQ